MEKENIERVGVRDILQGEYFWINNQVFKEFTEKTDKFTILIYCYLCFWAKENRNQKVYFSIRHLKSRFGLHYSVIDRSVKRLIEKGFISEIGRTSQKARIYQLLDVVKKPDVSEKNRQKKDIKSNLRGVPKTERGVPKTERNQDRIYTIQNESNSRVLKSTQIREKIEFIKKESKKWKEYFEEIKLKFYTFENDTIYFFVNHKKVNDQEKSTVSDKLSKLFFCPVKVFRE